MVSQIPIDMSNPHSVLGEAILLSDKQLSHVDSAILNL